MLLAKGAGCGAGHGAEDLGKIVVIADAHLLRNGRDGQTGLHQQTLGSLNAPITGLVMALSGIPRNLVYALNAIKEKKEA